MPRRPTDQTKKRQSPRQIQKEADLLRELALDFDWHAASKRAGLTPNQLENLMRDNAFVKRGQAIISKGIGDRSGVDDAIKRFKTTQDKLITALDDGDLTVSSALLKSHEMEFKMHGLFEKDNKQKGSSVSINITFENPNTKGSIELGAIENE